MSDSNSKLTYAQVAANPPSSTNNDEDENATTKSNPSNNDSENLNAYKSPPPTTDEDENIATESTGRDTLADTDDQMFTEKNYTSTSGAQFSKAADKVKSSIPSLPSTWSSEPEFINVEPPIPPPVDKMKKEPKPQPTPEPVKPSKPAANDEPKKKTKTSPPPIVDNVADDFAPLKHTTMLTKNKENGKGVVAAGGANGTTSAGESEEFEVISDETEKHRRYRNNAFIAVGGIVVIGAVAFGIWKWTHRAGRAK